MIYDRGITVLQEPTNAEVDIVFVHGFTGHPKSTWTLDAAKVKKRTETNRGRPSGAVFWPQDLLPTTVPTARIFTYGYDTKIRHFLQGQISRNTVQDHAWDLLCGLEAQRRSPQEESRPLIFVAHSLGGVVVRDALKQASHCQDTHPHHHALFLSTISVMFFGTPHRGADPRSGFHRVLSASAIGIGMNVNRQIMDTLLPTLGRPTDVDDFKILAWEAKWTVYSFQEETGVGLLLGKKVVEDNSSYLGPPVAETIQHISDNHMDMCRFHGLDDPSYLKVAAAFQRILATNDSCGLRVSSTLSPSNGLSGSSSQGHQPTIHAQAIHSPSEQASGAPTRQHLQIRVEEALPDDAYLTPSNEPLQDQNLLSAGETPSSAGQEQIIESLSATPRTPLTTHVAPGTVPSSSDTEGKMDIRPEGESKIDLETKKKLVDLLKFPELGARMVDIKPAQMQTCQWFLTNSNYNRWKNGDEGLCDSGFLWIKGKPGAGKSTLMKYLHSIHSRQANCTVISFFFNARGAELEKSTLGCYRTLLFLLLDGRQEVWEAMDHLGKAGSSYTVSNGWNIGPLTETFKNAVEVVAKKQPVECWIDALDECQDSEVEQMVSFFEDLDEFMLSKGLPFRVCFASRHYPTIVPRKAIQLVLEKEEDHKLDISKYITARLRMENSVHKSEIQDQLLEKSSGIFLWVALVIPILNRQYAGGRISAVRKRLNDIPPDLDALFHSILTRDREDMQELVLCLQWILFSIHPLEPLELYTAIQLSAYSHSNERLEAGDPRSSTWIAAREDQMSTEDLQHYVDSVSKGLAEVTTSSTVQFIHESVKDFLLGKSGRSDLLSGVEGFHFGNLGDIHESMKQVCLDYILVAYSAAFSNDSKALHPTTAETFQHLNDSRYPFLDYAVMNVLCHADQAYCKGISQDVFLHEFPIHKWTCLYNALGNVENDFKFKIFQTAPSFLYLLAQFDAHNLLRDHPELHQQFKLRCGGWGYPWMVVCAARRSNIESLRHLANAAVASSSSHVTSQEVDSMIHAMNRLFSRQKTPKGESDATVAAYLAAFGHGPLLESFLVQVGSRHCECQETPETFKTGSQICRTKVQNIVNSCPQLDGRTAIFCARTAEALEVLLAYGADPNVQDNHGWTAVHNMVRNCLVTDNMERLKAICSVHQVKLKLPCSICPAESALESSNHTTNCVDRLFEPLAPRFNINIRSNSGKTALSLAAATHDSAIVQLLLDAFPDIDIHLQDDDSRSPLSYAAQFGDRETVTLLLSRCSEADLQHLNRPDKDGRTIVSYAVDTEKAVDILRLLLAKFPQLEVDTPDNRGWTPLRYALRRVFLRPDLSLYGTKSLLATGRVNPFHADTRGLSPFARAKHRITLGGESMPVAIRRELLLEMIKTAENKEVMGKFQFEDEDLLRIEEEIAEARKMLEEWDFMIRTLRQGGRPKKKTENNTGWLKLKGRSWNFDGWKGRA